MNIPSKWQTPDRYDRIAWMPVIFIVRARASFRPVAGCRGSVLQEIATEPENTLFCQCTVQKVEPILSPERLIAINVGRRAEDLAVDRLLRQRVVARRRGPGSRSRDKLRRIESHSAGNGSQRRLVG